jgi:hypothetical protein
MTVSELISELSKFPDNLDVYYPCEDCIGGYANVLNVTRGVNEMDLMVVLDDYTEED